MKKSHTMYCYVDRIEWIDNCSIGEQKFSVGPAEEAIIHLQEVGRHGIIKFQTKDLALADSIQVGDRFEVALKYKPRKSGVVHMDS